MFRTLLRGTPLVKASAIGVAVTVAALAASAPGHAATLFSTGFEAPGYTVGQLAGQSGWSGNSNVVVQNTTVQSGAQAVSANSNTTGQLLTVQPTAYNSVGNTDQLVTISTDFQLNSLGNGVIWEVMSASGNGGFITQLLVNGATGQLCGFNGCSGPALTAGTWYNLSMTLDYSTGFVRDFVNGVEFSSGGFSNVPGHSDTLNFITIGTNNSLPAPVSTASWDNFSVTTAAIPEPATWAMMITGFGMIGFTARRKAAGARA